MKPARDPPLGAAAATAVPTTTVTATGRLARNGCLLLGFSERDLVCDQYLTLYGAKGKACRHPAERATKTLWEESLHRPLDLDGVSLVQFGHIDADGRNHDQALLNILGHRERQARFIRRILSREFVDSLHIAGDPYNLTAVEARILADVRCGGLFERLRSTSCETTFATGSANRRCSRRSRVGGATAMMKLAIPR